MSVPLIYQTATMIAALAQMPPAATFLKDRYFPTAPEVDMFGTEEVLMDIKDGEQKMAPVVLPRKKAITVERDSYRTDRLTPPLVAPQRPMTLDDLNARGFGEALFSTVSPEEREAAILAQDMEDMDRMITNREEAIAAQCMINNGYELKQYADEAGTDQYEPYELFFYNGANNPGRYTPATPWGQSGADILADLSAMVRMETEKGNPVSDFVAGSAVLDTLLTNDKIYKMLDNRRINLGDISPEALPSGASFFGQIVVSGITLNLFAYDVQVTNDEGVVAPMIPAGETILTAPASGRGMYGAISQLEADEKYHTYAGSRVPKFTSNVSADVRTLRLASRPLLVPRYATPWISAQVLS